MSALLLLFLFTTLVYAKNCEDGWTFFEKTGNCYKSFDKQHNFGRAEEQCNRFSAHLPSIHSVEENIFVFELVGRHFHWIGLHRRSSGDHRWQFTDGTEIVYFLWLPQEPKNEGARENCVQAYPKWNDINCNHKLKYVCKKNATIL